jgi:putative peptidoglycan lipid II flippase
MKVPMGVFGMAAGMAAFPTLTRLFTQGRSQDAHATLVSALRFMLLLAFVAQAGLTTAATEVATVIWGETRFTAAELAEIGLYTGVLCLGLWAWSAQMLVARGFYAQGNTWTPTLVGSVVMLGAFPLYGALAQRYGGLGLAISSSAAITAYLVALWFFLRRRIATASAGPGLFDALLRLTPAAGLGVAAGLGLGGVLPPLPALVHGALTGTLACLVCLGVAWILGVGEIQVLAQKLKSRLSSS